MKQALLINAVITVLFIVLAGMILDGGHILFVGSVGAAMCWLVIVVIAGMRKINGGKYNKIEKEIVKCSVLIFIFIAFICDIVLCKIGWDPELYKLINRL